MTYAYNLPDLENRFLPDEKWQSKDFINPKTDHKIHYSFSLADNPKATVVILPGLSEYGEKYIETIKFLNKNKFDCYVIDWAYQGRSTRFETNPQKRHSDGYESDLSDLEHFITHEINSKTPLYMLGHSMGGHIGLRYLATKKHNIKAASFSAPMIEVKDLKYIPYLFSLLFLPFKNHYATGGKDWRQEARKSDGTDIFSNDPVRDQVHNAWQVSNPELQIGNPTFKWVIETIKSMRFLQRKEVLRNIKIPVLMAAAGQETLVDNKAIKRASDYIKNATYLDLPKAKHEILMETDDSRNKFLEETLKVFNQ